MRTSIDSISDQIVSGTSKDRSSRGATTEITNNHFLDNDVPFVTMPLVHSLIKFLNPDISAVKTSKQVSRYPNLN